MSVNFSDILTKPLKFKNLYINLVLLFLPAALAGFTMGTDNWIFYTMHSMGLITLYGYLCEFIQNEIQFDGTESVEWKFLRNFFTGVRGVLFLLVNLSLLITLVLLIWLFIGNIPGFEDIIKIAAIGCFAYWLFVYYGVSFGIFAQEFNPAVALNISTIMQIANSSLYNYFIALIYMVIYTIIVGTLCWMAISTFGTNIFVIEIFAAYGIAIYSLLYSEVFKQVREEFDSYI